MPSPTRSQRPSTPPRRRPAAERSLAATITAFRDWFASRGWTAFEFQDEAWRAMATGESGLLHAPTGTGKTLAAWLGALARLADGGHSAAGGLKVV